MPGLQRRDVEETVRPDSWEKVAQGVADVAAAVMTALGLAGFMSGASRCHFGLCDVPLPERFITDHPTLVIGIPCAVLAVALCIKKRRAASRTRVNGNSENGGGAAEVLDDFFEAYHDSVSVGSDGGDENWTVRPPIRLPPVVSIPSPSSSRTSGGVSAGSGVVTAADVELTGARHHRRSTERERGVDVPGEAVRDGRGKNA